MKMEHNILRYAKRVSCFDLGFVPYIDWIIDKLYTLHNVHCVSFGSSGYVKSIMLPVNLKI